MTRPEGQVWSVDLAIADDLKIGCLALLSSEERDRADRFLRQADRDRFVVSHAAWRLILGRALDADPRALLFGVGPAGKPELAGPWRGRLDTNLSHSGDQALVGLSRHGRIGVDVEVVRQVPDALCVARHHFAAEEVAELEGRDPPSLSRTFMGLWTRKEAFAKACGLGLSLPLDSFVVSLPPRPAGLLSIGGDEAAARAWGLHGFAPRADHVAAVAVEGRATSLSIATLQPGWAARLLQGSPSPSAHRFERSACGLGPGSL